MFNRRSKKKYMFSVPTRFLFWGRLLFSSFFLFKKTRKIRSFSNFFFFFFFFPFFFFSGGKDRMLYRKIAFYIFRLPHQLFHLLWKLSRMSGGHLEKIGRPVVLENVSGGHFIKKKEKKKCLLLPFFHRGRMLNMFFFYFALGVSLSNGVFDKFNPGSQCLKRACPKEASGNYTLHHHTITRQTPISSTT